MNRITKGNNFVAIKFDPIARRRFPYDLDNIRALGGYILTRKFVSKTKFCIFIKVAATLLLAEETKSIMPKMETLMLGVMLRNLTLLRDCHIASRVKMTSTMYQKEKNQRGLLEETTYTKTSA